LYLLLLDLDSSPIFLLDEIDEVIGQTSLVFFIIVVVLVSWVN